MFERDTFRRLAHALWDGMKDHIPSKDSSLIFYDYRPTSPISPSMFVFYPDESLTVTKHGSLRKADDWQEAFRALKSHPRSVTIYLPDRFQPITVYPILADYKDAGVLKAYIPMEYAQLQHTYVLCTPDELANNELLVTRLQGHFHKMLLIMSHLNKICNGSAPSGHLVPSAFCRDVNFTFYNLVTHINRFLALPISDEFYEQVAPFPNFQLRSRPVRAMIVGLAATAFASAMSTENDYAKVLTLNPENVSGGYEPLLIAFDKWMLPGGCSSCFEAEALGINSVVRYPFSFDSIKSDPDKFIWFDLDVSALAYHPLNHRANTHQYRGVFGFVEVQYEHTVIVSEMRGYTPTLRAKNLGSPVELKSIPDMLEVVSFFRDFVLWARKIILGFPIYRRETLESAVSYLEQREITLITASRLAWAFPGLMPLIIPVAICYYYDALPSNVLTATDRRVSYDEILTRVFNARLTADLTFNYLFDNRKFFTSSTKHWIATRASVLHERV